MVIRNNELKDAFLALSKTVWQAIENHQKAGYPLLTLERKKANWTEIGLIITKHQEYNWVEFLQRYMSEIRKMMEFKKCVEIMKKDKIVNNHLEKRVGGFTTASLLQTPMVIEKFLIHLMSNLRGFDFELSSFLKVYQEMEDFFYGDIISVEIFVHLEGFSSNSEKLDLGNGWEISRIPQNQFDDLLTEGLLKDTPQMSQYALYWRLDTPKVILKEDDEFKSPWEYRKYESTVRRIVSALRLFKSGDIGFRRIISRYQGWLSGSGGISESFMKMFWGSYTLELNEIDEFRLLLDLLNESTDSAFDLSLKRLNDAVERQHPYDMMIDYMIAFESLFIFKKEYNKKSVLPKRVANIIGTSDSEREFIVDKLGLAYDVRNSIAHGDTEQEIRQEFQKTGYSNRDFVELIGSHLRRSMIAYSTFLSRGYVKNEIIQELEKKSRFTE